jgi:hypothetical protein
MMFRLVRFMIITLTLGRIKWLMRLTWVWRLIVFLGITGWLSKWLRQAVGLDKKQKTDVDSAWAEALRYTPSPATSGAGVTSSAAPGKPSPAEPQASTPVSETLSEVTGSTEDGAAETITMHEVSAEGETETIVRIADDAGNVETVVTGSPVEEIDLAHLGTPAEQDQAIEEIVEAEIETEAAIDEILDTLEAAEPDVEDVDIVEAVEVEVERAPKRRRAPKVVEPVDDADVVAEPEVLIDPDWVRGNGTHECPASHPVKAKASSMIYYMPESGHYDRTIPDVCFASDLDAEASGYRAPRR